MSTFPNQALLKKYATMGLEVSSGVEDAVNSFFASQDLRAELEGVKPLPAPDKRTILQFSVHTDDFKLFMDTLDALWAHTGHRFGDPQVALGSRTGPVRLDGTGVPSRFIVFVEVL